MIIETLTAFSAVKIVWESLEILHRVHVGHITGKASYKGGSAVKNAIQQYQLKWQDQKNPAQQLEREAKTLYDFQATGNATQAIQDINNQAEAYLTKLNNCVGNLKNAKEYFLAIHKSLTKLVHALTSNDDHQFSSQLLRFKSDFESFKDEFNQFLLSIEPPPRQLLYIADLFSGTEVIKQYNARLKTIKTYLDLLKQIEQDIADQFKQGFDVIPTLLSATNSSSVLSFEQLQQSIEQCMHDPERISETMHMILPENTKLAAICTDITQISATFKQNDKTEQTGPLEDNPNWFPLLTEAEQIEAGQRIVLHAMNETVYPRDKKLLLAQIFLRQHVSKDAINQIEVDLLSHEMANILRSWQIKKCEQLTQFLSTLTKERAWLPNSDPDGLLKWLKTKRRTQSSIALLTEVLVSPCCFSECSIESALAKFKRLAPDENATLIQQHLDSHWRDIWEKNDTLIRLPESFRSNILPRYRLEADDQSQNFNVISSVMHKLATALIADLQQLKTELENNQHLHLDVMVSSFYKKQKEAYKTQDNQEQETGVDRIKKAHRYIYSISSSSNSLFPYLYHAETINEVDKKRQVPTTDDLLHVIYRGVDPNGACYWKSSSSQPYSRSNQLAHYFFPDQQNDSRTEAWIYACTDCQVNAVPVFSHLFSPNDRPLALGNTPESQTAIKNNLSIQAILKDPKKITITTDSKALNGVAPKTVQETETVFQQLQNYYVLALVRVNPEYRNKLPLLKQLECLFKNFFKSTQEIGQERLESVQIYMGDFCAALSEEHVDAINKAFADLKKNYQDRHQQAKRVDKSALYTIMKKAFDGPIAAIINQFTKVDQKQLELEEENRELEEQLKKSQEIIDKMGQEKMESDAKLKESESKLAQYKAEAAAELEQYKAELDEKMKKITDFMDFMEKQQQTSTSSVSEAQTQESSNVRFFKH
ncbi:MAG: hypothetical protein WAL30_05845 [Candidatus Aquirickettsiella sp.]